MAKFNISFWNLFVFWKWVGWFLSHAKANLLRLIYDLLFQYNVKSTNILWYHHSALVLQSQDLCIWLNSLVFLLKVIWFWKCVRWFLSHVKTNFTEENLCFVYLSIMINNQLYYVITLYRWFGDPRNLIWVVSWGIPLIC